MSAPVALLVGGMGMLKWQKSKRIKDIEKEIADNVKTIDGLNASFRRSIPSPVILPVYTIHQSKKAPHMERLMLLLFTPYLNRCVDVYLIIVIHADGFLYGVYCAFSLIRLHT